MNILVVCVALLSPVNCNIQPRQEPLVQPRREEARAAISIFTDFFHSFRGRAVQYRVFDKQNPKIIITVNAIVQSQGWGRFGQVWPPVTKDASDPTSDRASATLQLQLEHLIHGDGMYLRAQSVRAIDAPELKLQPKIFGIEDWHTTKIPGWDSFLFGKIWTGKRYEDMTDLEFWNDAGFSDSPNLALTVRRETSECVFQLEKRGASAIVKSVAMYEILADSSGSYGIATIEATI